MSMHASHDSDRSKPSRSSSRSSSSSSLQSKKIELRRRKARLIAEISLEKEAVIELMLKQLRMERQLAILEEQGVIDVFDMNRVRKKSKVSKEKEDCKVLECVDSQKVDACHETPPPCPPELEQGDEAGRTVVTPCQDTSLLESRWRDDAGEIDKSEEENGQHEYPPFAQFADSDGKAAKNASIPELVAISREQQRPVALSPAMSVLRTFSTSWMQPAPKHDGPFLSCLFCDGNHLIDHCSQFAEQSLEDRRPFFFRKMLGFSRGPIDEHRSRDCRDRRACSACNKWHWSCFHLWQSNDDKMEDRRIPPQGA